MDRRYTARVLVDTLKRATSAAPGCEIAELGGANSCFMQSIGGALAPRTYHVIDMNRFGLNLLRKNMPEQWQVLLHECDVTQSAPPVTADVSFSVGLVEHFDEQNTKKAVAVHFDIVKPGGYVVISYPTPTPLYVIARWICELLGAWRFPDERALKRHEVLQAAEQFGTLTYEKLLVPPVFTSVSWFFARKNPAFGSRR